MQSVTKNIMLGEDNGDIWCLPLLPSGCILRDEHERKMCGSIGWKIL